MDKETIMDYVMETPTNTNPRILGQMLEQNSEGNGSGSTNIMRVLFTEGDGSITTETTSEEIYNAYTNGTFVFADFGYNDPDEGFGYINRNMPLVVCDNASYVFTLLYSSTGVFYARSIEGDPENGIRFFESQLQNVHE